MANIADKVLGKPTISPNELEVIEIEDFASYRVLNIVIRNLSTDNGSSVEAYIEGKIDVENDTDADFWYQIATNTLGPDDESGRSYPSNSGAYFNMRGDDLAFDRLRLILTSRHSVDVVVAAYGESRT